MVFPVSTGKTSGPIFSFKGWGLAGSYFSREPVEGSAFGGTRPAKPEPSSSVSINPELPSGSVALASRRVIRGGFTGLASVQCPVPRLRAGIPARLFWWAVLFLVYPAAR